MSQISKCPKITVVLSYWEALGEVSELSYKSLLYSTSIGSYCRVIHILGKIPKKYFGGVPQKASPTATPPSVKYCKLFCYLCANLCEYKQDFECLLCLMMMI